MDIFRIATGATVVFGLPFLSMIQPAPRPTEGDLRPSVAVKRAEAVDAANANSGNRPVFALSDAEKGAAGMTEASSVQNPAAMAFGAEIRHLSDEADSVDRLWQGYRTQCGVSAESGAGFGREWFSVLDSALDNESASAAERRPGLENRAETDCVDLLKLIRQSGSGIRRDLRKVVGAARRARVDPGTQVGLLRWHSLELP